MIKTLTYLILINSLYCFDWWQQYSTCVYTNNILYVYDTNRNDTKSPGISKYSLKDGPIAELKPEYFNLPDGNSGNSPVFINIPDDIRKSIPQGDKAWMLLFSNGSYSQSGDVYYPNGGLRYVNDEERITKFDIKLNDPRSNNMTQSAYAVTGIREGDSYSVYINGGITNKPGYKHTVITNGFQKYDFKANKWTDFGKKVVNDITSAFHKAVNVDDKMIYYLGGVYVYSDYRELPIMETNYTMFYNTFEYIKRYNLTSQSWDSIKTSVSGSVPFDLRSGRYGFSAAYSNRKIYVYGGIISKNAPDNKGALVEEEYISDYLGILDIDNMHIWEWYQPKEPNGQNSNRKLAFHDSIIYKNQLILTHGGISDDNSKYKVHAIDLDTKNFSDYIGPSPNVKSDNGNGSSGLPGYAIAIIVVAVIIIVLIIGYLVYRRRRKSKSKKNNSTPSLQEVWATPQNAIVNTKSSDNTGTDLTGNTATNKTPLNSDFEDERKGPDASRMTQFYMDLPYFQHEVDTHDTQIDYLAKDQQNQISK